MLFENWDKFVALGPDEKIVQVYKKVKAGKLRKVPEFYDSIDIELHDTAEGDLLLTDKRLIHLEYEYKVDKESKESLGQKPVILKALLYVIGGILGIIVAIVVVIVYLFAILSIFFIPVALFLLISPQGAPIGALLFSLSLISLAIVFIGFSSYKREPSGYKKVYFEVFLSDIDNVDIYSSSSVLLELKHRKAVSLKFQEEEKMNEFRKNISALIYEIKHKPKETISYNIVAEFSLAEDGTILVKCPYCGAPAPLNSKDTKIVCKYCGKTYIIPKKILDLLTS
jgi:DNA-directed RNA polymerase subunit RPC12/RpoP